MILVYPPDLGKSQKRERKLPSPPLIQASAQGFINFAASSMRYCVLPVTAGPFAPALQSIPARCCYFKGTQALSMLSGSGLHQFLRIFHRTKERVWCHWRSRAVARRRLPTVCRRVPSVEKTTAARASERCLLRLGVWSASWLWNSCGEAPNEKGPAGCPAGPKLGLRRRPCRLCLASR